MKECAEVTTGSETEGKATGWFKLVIHSALLNSLKVTGKMLKGLMRSR